MAASPPQAVELGARSTGSPPLETDPADAPGIEHEPSGGTLGAAPLEVQRDVARPPPEAVRTRGDQWLGRLVASAENEIVVAQCDVIRHIQLAAVVVPHQPGKARAVRPSRRGGQPLALRCRPPLRRGGPA